MWQYGYRDANGQRQTSRRMDKLRGKKQREDKQEEEEETKEDEQEEAREYIVDRQTRWVSLCIQSCDFYARPCSLVRVSSLLFSPRKNIPVNSTSTPYDTTPCLAMPWLCYAMRRAHLACHIATLKARLVDWLIRDSCPTSSSSNFSLLRRKERPAISSQPLKQGPVLAH